MAKDKKRHEDLNQVVKDLVLNAGAIDVGIVTTETLEGGPFSPCRWTRKRSSGF
jgi:hypothetical protein